MPFDLLNTLWPKFKTLKTNFLWYFSASNPCKEQENTWQFYFWFWAKVENSLKNRNLDSMAEQ